MNALEYRGIFISGGWDIEIPVHAGESAWSVSGFATDSSWLHVYQFSTDWSVAVLGVCLVPVLS